jgi:hypothetical protein
MNATTTTPGRVKPICEWCGAGWEVLALDATDRRTGRAVVLHLCEACRRSGTRTWRLRYEAVRS